MGIGDDKHACTDGSRRHGSGFEGVRKEEDVREEGWACSIQRSVWRTCLIICCP